MTAPSGTGQTGSIVVFERQPCWEPELRRQFDQSEVTIRACRSPGDLEQLTDAADAIVIANLPDAPAEVLRWLSRRLIGGRSLPVIVVTDQSTAALQWHVREAGATALVRDELGGHQMARLCRKLWAGNAQPTLRKPT